MNVQVRIVGEIPIRIQPHAVDEAIDVFLTAMQIVLYAQESEERQRGVLLLAEALEWIQRLREPREKEMEK